MTKTELTDNLTFLSALKQLEYLASNGILTGPDAARVRKELDRKNFRDGKAYYNYASFLGYRRGPDGLPEIDPEEAAIVRRIFARYLMGQSIHQIARDLMADGIRTAQGREKWNDSVIQNMLRNEKYIGDALLQKTYIADLFNRQVKKNNGELPMYYVEDCHPAIIDRETYQKVQEEIARRSSLPEDRCQDKDRAG